MNAATTKIETAVHNEKSETEKNGAKDELAPLPKNAIGAATTGQFIAKAPVAAATPK